MAGDESAPGLRPFAPVLQAVDRLSRQTGLATAHDLALQVIFLREARRPEWEPLTRMVQAAPGRLPAWRALEFFWRRTCDAGPPGLESRDAAGAVRLPDQEDQLLAALIRAVAAEKHAEGMYEACLDWYSSKCGTEGEYYTPLAVAQMMASMIAPRPDERVYDPACGSGGFLVQAAEFAKKHSAGQGELLLHGRDSAARVYRVAAMNLVLHSFDADLGSGEATDSLRASTSGAKADIVLTNPPFNQRGWGYEELTGDRRWDFGVPPQGNANFAWIQHVISQLSDHGRAGILMANGAAKGVREAEREIRRSLVEKDLIASIIALPERIFHHTNVSACVWVLSKDKGVHPGWGRIPRRGEVLFIDARRLGQKTGGKVTLSEADIDRICRTSYAWRGNDSAGNAIAFADEPGWCRSVSVDEITKARHDLMPTTYVRAKPDRDAQPPVESAGEPREELYECFAEAARLERQLRSVLEAR